MRRPRPTQCNLPQDPDPPELPPRPVRSRTIDHVFVAVRDGKADGFLAGYIMLGPSVRPGCPATGASVLEVRIGYDVFPSSSEDGTYSLGVTLGTEWFAPESSGYGVNIAYHEFSGTGDAVVAGLVDAYTHDRLFGWKGGPMVPASEAGLPLGGDLRTFPSPPPGLDLKRSSFASAPARPQQVPAPPGTTWYVADTISVDVQAAPDQCVLVVPECPAGAEAFSPGGGGSFCPS